MNEKQYMGYTSFDHLMNRNTMNRLFYQNKFKTLHQFLKTMYINNFKIKELILVLISLFILSCEPGKIGGTSTSPTSTITTEGSINHPPIEGYLINIPDLVLPQNPNYGEIRWAELPTFKIPPNKVLIFMGAGRNQAIESGKDIFSWGFTHVDQTRMIINKEYTNNPTPGWVSSLPPNRRAITISGSYYVQDAFSIWWANDYNQWKDVWFEKPDYRSNLGLASRDILPVGQYYFNDNSQFPYDRIHLDVENIGNGNESFFQEHVNLFNYMAYQFKSLPGAKTVTGLEPVGYNGFSNPKKEHYINPPIPAMWNTPVKETVFSKQRGMPSYMEGKTVESTFDENMGGNYWYDVELFPEGEYDKVGGGKITIDHTNVNWLKNLLANQEINMLISPKPRVAWQWLFNNDGYIQVKKTYYNSDSTKSLKVENNFPDIMMDKNTSEGIGVWLFTTGAKGAVLWDNAYGLSKKTTTLLTNEGGYNVNYTGQGNDRKYENYENYLIGLSRLFKDNEDVFTGTELYLNDKTEVSYDLGETWVKYNAVEITEKRLPFVRLIINEKNNKLIVVAQNPYNYSNKTELWVKYSNWIGKIKLDKDKLFISKNSF